MGRVLCHIMQLLTRRSRVVECLGCMLGWMHLHLGQLSVHVDPLSKHQDVVFTGSVRHRHSCKSCAADVCEKRSLARN